MNPRAPRSTKGRAFGKKLCVLLSAAAVFFGCGPSLTARAASRRHHARDWYYVNLRGTDTLCGLTKGGQFLCFLPQPAHLRRDRWSFLHQYSAAI